MIGILRYKVLRTAIPIRKSITIRSENPDENRDPNPNLLAVVMLF